MTEPRRPLLLVLSASTVGGRSGFSNSWLSGTLEPEPRTARFGTFSQAAWRRTDHGSPATDCEEVRAPDVRAPPVWRMGRARRRVDRDSLSDAHGCDERGAVAGLVWKQQRCELGCGIASVLLVRDWAVLGAPDPGALHGCSWASSGAGLAAVAHAAA